MGKKALVLSPTGGGKSHSLQYLDPKISFIINPDNKELPWRGFEKDYVQNFKTNGDVSIQKSNYIVTKSMKDIKDYLWLISEKRPEITTVAIDTITHAMVKSVISRIMETGYTKFNNFAEEFYNLIEMIDKMRPDLFVVITAHTEILDDSNDKKVNVFKIPAGKLTRQSIDPESLFTVVLGSGVKIVEGKTIGYFETNGNGFTTLKSPSGMFPHYIPNNMQMVRDRIFAYYANNDELPEMEELIITEKF
jgi:ABC-type iron transport system FetAB ATPase subunit